MTVAAELLTSLTQRGIRLSAVDGRLRAEAPTGTLTPEDRLALATRKVQLLALLRCPQCYRPLDEKSRCWKCHYRTCTGCGRDSGSAFIELCFSCGCLLDCQSAGS